MRTPCHPDNTQDPLLTSIYETANSILLIELFVNRDQGPRGDGPRIRPFLDQL